MPHAPDRRDFLKTTIVGAAGLTVTGALTSVGTFGRAFAKGQDPLSVTRLTDKIFMVSGAGANVTVLHQGDQVLMIDGGTKERSAELLKLIARETGTRKVAVLFNTMWRPQHTGSNERLGKAGTKIIAQMNTKLWLGTTFNVPWEGKKYTPLPKVAQPNEAFYTKGGMTFAGEKVEYGWLPRARTDGDLYVSFPDSKVLAAGDVLCAGSYPIIDYMTGGWLGGMSDATKTLLGLTGPDTRLIPGNGRVLTKVDLQAEHDMVSTVNKRMIEMFRMGYSADDMVKGGATKEFDEAWGDPTMFMKNAYQAMWGHVVGLGIF
jgi:glyoxylase-like metal-dependent hydrolase (beta-lactamase superfamily II)